MDFLKCGPTLLLCKDRITGKSSLYDTETKQTVCNHVVSSERSEFYLSRKSEAMHPCVVCQEGLGDDSFHSIMSEYKQTSIEAIVKTNKRGKPFQGTFYDPEGKSSWEGFMQYTRIPWNNEAYAEKVGIGLIDGEIVEFVNNIEPNKIRIQEWLSKTHQERLNDFKIITTDKWHIIHHLFKSYSIGEITRFDLLNHFLYVEEYDEFDLKVVSSKNRRVEFLGFVFLLGTLSLRNVPYATNNQEGWFLYMEILLVLLPKNGSKISQFLDFFSVERIQDFMFNQNNEIHEGISYYREEDEIQEEIQELNNLESIEKGGMPKIVKYKQKPLLDKIPRLEKSIKKYVDEVTETKEKLASEKELGDMPQEFFQILSTMEIPLNETNVPKLVEMSKEHDKKRIILVKMAQKVIDKIQDEKSPDAASGFSTLVFDYIDSMDSYIGTIYDEWIDLLKTKQRIADIENAPKLQLKFSLDILEKKTDILNQEAAVLKRSISRISSHSEITITAGRVELIKNWEWTTPSPVETVIYLENIVGLEKLEDLGLHGLANTPAVREARLLNARHIGRMDCPEFADRERRHRLFKIEFLLGHFYSEIEKEEFAIKEIEGKISASEEIYKKFKQFI